MLDGVTANYRMMRSGAAGQLMRSRSACTAHTFSRGLGAATGSAVLGPGPQFATMVL
jgi:hypothetical protein